MSKLTTISCLVGAAVGIAEAYSTIKLVTSK